MAADAIRVVVSGAAGNMGRTVCAAVDDAPDTALVAVVDPRLEGDVPLPAEVSAALASGEGSAAADPVFASLEEALEAVEADVVVDFTWAEAVRVNLDVCLRLGVAAVVGTTGLARQDLEEFGARASTAGVPILLAPNFALGAVLMMEFARQAARHFDHAEIVELHHEQKRDAPSGTARRTAGLIEDEWRARGHEAEVAAHSVRLPGLVADQEVIFGALGQTLRIEHRTTSRESFMPGVLIAVRAVRGLQGLVVGLENIL